MIERSPSSVTRLQASATASVSTSDIRHPTSDIVISGLGLVTAAGQGAPALLAALRSGRSGIAPIESFRASGLSVSSGGRVPDEALGPGPVPDRLLRMCELAAREALAGASRDHALDPQQVGLAFGTALGSVESLEELVRASGDRERREDLRRSAALPELTRRLAERLGLGGPASTFSMTCASGLCALEQAAADLRLGRARAMLVGGADTLSRFMQSGFCSLKALSPSGELRPFARERDGIVLGEGAAFVLVERLEEARRRGARVLGRVAASRLVSDASHLTSPDESGAGMARAIDLALAEARLGAGAIGAVTVTATGSPVYDRMLSRAVRSALGPEGDRVPVTTWERATGHALASTAVLGMVHACQALVEGEVQGVGEIPSLDPACELRYLRSSARLERAAVLSLTVGFGGQNGATIIAGES